MDDILKEFDDIRPYLEDEIPEAMKRIANHPYFKNSAEFVFPDKNVEDIRTMVENITSCAEFQRNVMSRVNRSIIEKTCTGFKCTGIEHINPEQNHLFISNHRDIMLDASLLCYCLFNNGINTPEITFGANLMQGDFIIDIGKSNKMFRVERPSSDFHEFIHQSRHLSDYIRFTIGKKGQSVWMAQRNGRTKDGTDRTDQGIIRMLAMSRSNSLPESISSLHIVPVSISYEWEPCDILKACELSAAMSGPYVKKPGEDLNSILTGILQPKGRVHLSFCESISEEDLKDFSHLPHNVFCKETAFLIDRRICSSYLLFPNNYIAHDMRDGNSRFAKSYTESEKEQFQYHLEELLKNHPDRETIRKLLLGIYANPVDSKSLFEQ
ncbi:MAG: 1-acyl-sn-glycerol-3-phosphate acyltransferase [Alistipes sp.]|nr:1-acyl-sn-glycerol-3-phosphate acyltransferase [Candidatus Minthomonas equi]